MTRHRNRVYCVDHRYRCSGAAFPKLWSADPCGSVGSARNYCFLLEFREKMCKLLHTVTSINLLVKALLFLLINTSGEGDYYIGYNVMSFQQSEVKKTAWRSKYNLKRTLTILV